MLNSFACDYSDLENIVLSGNPDVECFGSHHILLVSAAIVCLVVYFPSSTLLSPVLQFQNKVLDIKFESSFFIANKQSYLLTSGVAIFYGESLPALSLLVQLVAVVALLCLM